MSSPIKSLVQNYSSFNTWANKRIVEWLKSLPSDILTAEVKSSYTSIDFTLQHILRTQRFWLYFINEKDTSGLNWNVRHGETEAVLKELIEVSEAMEDTFGKLSDEELSQIMHLDTPWAKNDLPRYEYIIHIVNHGSFHRGQIITIARTLGITEGVVNTDYNIFNTLKR